MEHRKLELLTDFYEITMANGYLVNGMADTIAYFDEVTRLSKFIASICSSIPMESAMNLATSTSMPANWVIAASE